MSAWDKAWTHTSVVINILSTSIDHKRNENHRWRDRQESTPHFRGTESAQRIRDTRFNQNPQRAQILGNIRNELMCATASIHTRQRTARNNGPASQDRLTMTRNDGDGEDTHNDKQCRHACPGVPLQHIRMCEWLRGRDHRPKCILSGTISQWNNYPNLYVPYLVGESKDWYHWGSSSIMEEWIKNYCNHIRQR